MNATQHGYASDQKRIIARLNRIEGQVRGIRQMTENGEYCIDILTQISAADSALKSVALLLLDDHLHHCDQVILVHLLHLVNHLNHVVLVLLYRLFLPCLLLL